MSTGTGIEWTEATWNPVVGCTPVSPGCLNCYAATMARRLEAMGRPEYVGLTVRRGQNDLEAGGGPGRDVFAGTVRCLEDRLTIPLGWRKPRMIFVNSMSDLFHEAVPFEFIDRVFAVAALCPQHTFQVLTKRPERMAEYLEGGGKHRSGAVFQAQIDAATKYDLESTRPGCRYPGEYKKPMQCAWPLPNVWLGASAEDQPRLSRAWELLKCPAAVRFLSCEPLIGPVDLNAVELLCESWRRGATIGTYLDWVIVGGESGANARPCDVAWVRSIVEQCKAAGTACFVKQLGSNAGWHAPEPVMVTHRGGVKRPASAPFPMPSGFQRLPLKHSKGGDPAEWPEDLRVREMPRDVGCRISDGGCEGKAVRA